MRPLPGLAERYSDLRDLRRTMRKIRRVKVPQTLASVLLGILALTSCSSSSADSTTKTIDTLAAELPTTENSAANTNVAVAGLRPMLHPVLQIAKLEDPDVVPPSDAAPGTAIFADRNGFAYLVGTTDAQDDIFNPGAQVDSVAVDGAASWVITLSIRSDDASMSVWSNIVKACSASTPACPTGRVAVVIGDRVVTSPSIPTDAELDSGIFTISGDFTEAAARGLAEELSRS